MGTHEVFYEITFADMIWVDDFLLHLIDGGLYLLLIDVLTTVNYGYGNNMQMNYKEALHQHRMIWIETILACLEISKIKGDDVVFWILKVILAIVVRGATLTIDNAQFAMLESSAILKMGDVVNAIERVIIDND
ncbi:hypothetical protein ACJX0J_037599 [Zea mays]